MFFPFFSPYDRFKNLIPKCRRLTTTTTTTTLLLLPLLRRKKKSNPPMASRRLPLRVAMMAFFISEREKEVLENKKWSFWKQKIEVFENKKSNSSETAFFSFLWKEGFAVFSVRFSFSASLPFPLPLHRRFVVFAWMENGGCRIRKKLEIEIFFFVLFAECESSPFLAPNHLSLPVLTIVKTERTVMWLCLFYRQKRLLIFSPLLQWVSQKQVIIKIANLFFSASFLPLCPNAARQQTSRIKKIRFFDVSSPIDFCRAWEKKQRLWNVRFILSGVVVVVYDACFFFFLWKKCLTFFASFLLPIYSDCELAYWWPSRRPFLGMGEGRRVFIFCEKWSNEKKKSGRTGGKGKKTKKKREKKGGRREKNKKEDEEKESTKVFIRCCGCCCCGRWLFVDNLETKMMMPRHSGEYVFEFVLLFQIVSRRFSSKKKIFYLTTSNFLVSVYFAEEMFIVAAFIPGLFFFVAFPLQRVSKSKQRRRHVTRFSPPPNIASSAAKMKCRTDYITLNSSAEECVVDCQVEVLDIWSWLWEFCNS